MKILELIRLEESTEGTFGILKIDKRVFCVTLEPEDKLNKPNESSIPAQQYICRRAVSPRHGETFRIKDVPGRYGILFHKGNLEFNSEGCILLGQYVDKLRGNRGIKNSGDTFKAFMLEMQDETYCHLTIREVY